MSITPTAPAHMTVTVKQQFVPTGTLALADTQILPSQPGGNGLGAGERSLFTSATVKPGHTPAIDTVEVALQPVIRWMYELPCPGHTWSVPKCLFTCPSPPGPLHMMSTLPSQ